MSLALERVVPITVHDPRVIQQERIFPVLKGAEQVLYKQWGTTSVSDSSMTFQAPPPSAALYVDRKVHLKVPVRIYIASASTKFNNAVYPAVAGEIALRSFPIQKALENIQMTINNQSMSINIGDILSALEHFNMSAHLKAVDYSKCASYPSSFCQSYSDLALNSSRHPLGINSSSHGCDVPKNQMFAVPVNTVTTSGGADASSWGTLGLVVDLVSCERVLVLTSSIALTADSRTTLSAQAWSYPEDTTPQLFFQYLTPQLVDRGVSSNKVLNYPYYNVERYPSTSGSAAARSGVTLTDLTMNSTNVQLNSIPTKLYVFARQPNSDMQLNPFNPDSFLRLKSINIQWGNRSGLLASASRQQLYDISCRAGCTLSWVDWSGDHICSGTAGATFGAVGSTGNYRGAGSIMAIDPLDLGLDSIDAPGKLDQITLQVNCVFNNISLYTCTPTMYVVAVSAGVFTLYNGQASSLIGILNSNDILNSHQQTAGKMLNYFDAKAVYGGGFLSDLRNDLSKMKRGKKEGAGACAGAGAVSGAARVSRVALRDRLA